MLGNERLSPFRGILDVVASVATIAAALAILIVIGSNWLSGGKIGQAPPSTVAPRAVDAPPRTAEGKELSLQRRGDLTVATRIVIVEFSDFQCPYCGAYARNTYARVTRDFVAPKTVDYAFRHLPLRSIHPMAAKAGEAAECAREQGRFADMHDRLFADQKHLSDGDLVEHAVALGLDDKRFKTCLSGRMASTVKGDEEDAARLGIMSTPTFLIGLKQDDGRITIRRQVTGANPYDEIKTAVDALSRELSSTKS